MFLVHFLLVLCTGLAATAAPHKARQDGFTNSKTFVFDGTSLPDGLAASNYPAGQHSFSSSNAFVSDGYLQLKVPGGQAIGSVACGEVSTTMTNILFGSVRTVAILSQPAGTVNGMFFYKSDTQESDIEWVSDPASTSNNGVPQLWFTNQNVNGNGPSTYTSILPPADATSVEHEYRTDWYQDHVAFYVDGVQKWSTTENVPSVPGEWIWNNWSDGNKGWSAGPPAEDSIFKVKNITLYYNTAA